MILAMDFRKVSSSLEMIVMELFERLRLHLEIGF